MSLVSESIKAIERKKYTKTMLKTENSKKSKLNSQSSNMWIKKHQRQDKQVWICCVNSCNKTGWRQKMLVWTLNVEANNWITEKPEITIEAGPKCDWMPGFTEFRKKKKGYRKTNGKSAIKTYKVWVEMNAGLKWEKFQWKAKEKVECNKEIDERGTSRLHTLSALACPRIRKRKKGYKQAKPKLNSIW